MLLGKMFTLMLLMLVTKAKQSSYHSILVIEEAKLPGCLGEEEKRSKCLVASSSNLLSMLGLEKEHKIHFY